MMIVKPLNILSVIMAKKKKLNPIKIIMMKTLINTLVISIIALFATSCMSIQGQSYAQSHYDDYYYDNGGGVSLQVFHNALSPHGNWIRHGVYGEVWVPRVRSGFHPYATNGYWVMTDYGNTWVSDFSWGWAPFHYGRWFYDNYYGWAWVPGYE